MYYKCIVFFFYCIPIMVQISYERLKHIQYKQIAHSYAQPVFFFIIFIFTLRYSRMWNLYFLCVFVWFELNICTLIDIVSSLLLFVCVGCVMRPYIERETREPDTRSQIEVCLRSQVYYWSQSPSFISVNSKVIMYYSRIMTFYGYCFVLLLLLFFYRYETRTGIRLITGH